MSLKKLYAAATATGTAVAALSAPQAMAADAQTVMFGDSVFANPTYGQIGTTSSLSPSASTTLSSATHGIEDAPGAPSPQGCPQGQSNVGRELGRVSGQHVANYACSAAKAAGHSHRKDFDEQINGAIANSDLNGATKNVLIQFGANDFQEIVRPSLSSSNPYYDGMKHSIQRIRHAAPNARITVVGYPAISARNGAVCPLRTSAPGSSEAGFNLDYAGLVRTGEDQVNSAMYKAARANGVQYYNLRADSIDHGMCAPDSSRWISGKWEYSVPHNLFNHLTHLGNRNVAQLLNSKVLAH